MNLYFTTLVHFTEMSVLFGSEFIQQLLAANLTYVICAWVIVNIKNADNGYTMNGFNNVGNTHMKQKYLLATREYTNA